MKRAVVLMALLGLSLPLWTQQDSRPPAPPREGQGGYGRGAVGEPTRMFGPGRAVAGTITEMKPDGFVLKTMSGKTVTVKVNGDTRFFRERQPIKLSDFKAGDEVAVAGEAAGEDAWTANFVVDRSAAMARFRAGLGKEFVLGEVKAIDGTKLTVARQDGQSQTIVVDENTSFRRQRQSVTLADISPGDGIFARGELKNGIFVASTVNVGDAQRMFLMSPMMGPGMRPAPSDGPPPKD